MNIDKQHYITPDEYDKLQPTYNCKTEYINDNYISTIFTDLKISLRDIF